MFPWIVTGNEKMCKRLGVTTLMFLSLAGIVSAADVETAVSTRETYVGVPIVFRIQINNAFRYEPPEMPEVDGLIIESVGGAIAQQANHQQQW